MCGIAGFNWKDRELGEKMGACLLHRGPDASGIFTDEGVTLSHRRLSIIDLSASANQPMFDNGKRFAVIFNGEIYNYKELREELRGEYDFKTESDTEVILAGYKKWGKEAVKKLNGIFSLAIWDKNANELFCARDHMGVKPFYYYWDGDRFIFASEVKSILVHDVPRRLNLSAFNKYLRVLYSPEPDTLIQNIFKLPPGSSLRLKDKDLTIETYYTPARIEKKWRYSEAVKVVHDTVTKAVQRQLVSDVPVGIYLSGGIDSSIVLAAVSKIKKNVKTFSIGFDLEEGEEKGKFNRDFELAAETAKFFGAEHHPLTISVSDVASGLEEIIGSIDDPISNPTAIPMAYLSRFAKKEVTVVLGGNGGDELFGGYDRYKLSRLRDALSWVPWLKGAKALDRLVLFEFQKDMLLERVVRREFLTPEPEVKKAFQRYVGGAKNATDAFILADIRSWLPDQALWLGDRMSMRGSLEERVPFLDREVVDLSMSLPLDFKVTAFESKKILKDAFRNELPPQLFKEPKRGWFSPGAKWLRRPEILSIVEKILDEDYYEGTSDLFDWPAIKSMLLGHVEKKEYNLTMLWAIMTFQIWAKTYKVHL